MGLGRRDARRHETVAIQAFADASSDQPTYTVGQTVMTLDGFPGKIESISAGPIAGTDVYHVSLDGGLGGGEYTESQISTASSKTVEGHTAVVEHTAADDYPELGTILIDRPDIAVNTRLGSKTASSPSEADVRSWYDSTKVHRTPLYDEELLDGQKDNAELQHSPGGTDGDGHMATWRGEYLGHYPSEAVARHHLYHTMNESGDTSGQVVHRNSDEQIDRREDVRADQHLWSTDHKSWLAKHDPKAHAILNADDLTDRVNDAVKATPDQEHFLNSNPTGPTKYSAKEDVKRDIGGAHCPKCKYWGLNYTGGMSCPLCGTDMVAGSPVANQVHDPSDFTDAGSDSDVDSGDSSDSDGSSDSSNSTTAARDQATCPHTDMPWTAHDQCPSCGAFPMDEDKPCTDPWCVDNEAEHDERDHVDPSHRDEGHPDYASAKAGVDEVSKQPHVQDDLSDLDIMPHGPSKYSVLVDSCERCGAPISFQEGVWLDSGMGEGCTDDEGEEGEHRPHPVAGTPKRSSLDVDALLVTAVSDTDFRFQLTAAWSDVQRKAKRIRAEGGVNISLATEGMVIGNVKGDTHVYESGLQRLPGKKSIAAWSCGCKWGAYHWGAPDDTSRFAGRMCSHVLALQFEAQARGMFGKSVYEDNDKPSWVPRKVVVKYDINDDKSLKARSSLDAMSAEAPAITLVREGALDADSLIAIGVDLTAAVNSPWGEPIAEVAPKAPGATQPHSPNDNPGSMGWASAPDPQNWGMQNPSMTNAEGIGGIQGSLHDEFLFEASDSDEGAEAILHDEPEAALPSTDGDVSVPLPRHDQNVMPADSSGMPNGKSPWQDPGNDEELTPDDLSLATMGSVDAIVADFQKSAGHLATDAAATAGNADIAAAAREFLSKEAVATFSPAEQAEIINEGVDQRAANLDRLDIAGTHYEHVEASLSDLEDDDQLWQ